MKRVKSVMFLLSATSAWPALAQSNQAPVRADPVQAGSSSEGVAQAVSGEATGSSEKPVAAPTQAGGASDGNAGLDIIVTARKQNETLLRTPATVTVLSSESLVAANVTSGNQLSNIVPGLVQQPGVGSMPGTTFRGLGSNSSVFSVETSVAQYQDGVYLGHLRDFITPLYDVDRVEFIKGTQSTLLGKNTSLGAISITNRRPTDEFGYEGRISHSFAIDQNLAQFAVNLPLSDKILTRTAFLLSDENGYYRNQYTGQREPNLRDVSGRFTVLFRPTETLSATVIYQHDDHRVRGQAYELLNDPSSTVRNRAAAAGQANLNVVPDGIGTGASYPIGGTVKGDEPYDRQHTNHLALIVNAELGDFTLTSQTSYLNYTATYRADLDFTAANLFNLTDTQRNELVSEELRINSPTGGSLTYLAGIFFYYDKWQLDRTYGGSPSNTVGFPLVGSTSGSFDQPTYSVSPFASANFRPFDKVRISAGVRYTHERKEGDFVRSGVGTFASSFPNIPFTRYKTQITNPVDYDLGAQYEPTANLMLYASHSKGSKSGGFQEFPTTIAAGPFSGERAYTTEIGAKLRLPAGGYITGALFKTLIKDFQINNVVEVGTPPVSTTFVQNADIGARGFEGSAGFRIAPGLRVSGSVVYSDGEFSRRFPTVGPVIGNDGDRITRAPEFTSKIAVDYERSASDDLTVFGGASMDTSSSFLLQFAAQRPDAPTAKSYQLLNARIGVRSRSSGLELAVVGTNLGNDRYVTFATPVSAGGTGIGNQAFYGTYTRPRIVALQLSIKR